MIDKTGVSKSHSATAAGFFPGTVTGTTMYITGINNGQASDSVTISEANAAGAAAETTKAVVKAGSQFTPETPIGPLTEGRKMHTDKGSVTVTYITKGGAAITGPTGQTFTSTSY